MRSLDQNGSPHLAQKNWIANCSAALVRASSSIEKSSIILRIISGTVLLTLLLVWRSRFPKDQICGQMKCHHHLCENKKTPKGMVLHCDYLVCPVIDMSLSLRRSNLFNKGVLKQSSKPDSLQKLYTISRKIIFYARGLILVQLPFTLNQHWCWYSHAKYWLKSWSQHRCMLGGLGPSLGW